MSSTTLRLQSSATLPDRRKKFRQNRAIVQSQCSSKLLSADISPIKVALLCSSRYKSNHHCQNKQIAHKTTKKRERGAGVGVGERERERERESLRRPPNKCFIGSTGSSSNQVAPSVQVGILSADRCVCVGGNNHLRGVPPHPLPPAASNITASEESPLAPDAQFNGPLLHSKSRSFFRERKK